MSCVVITEVRRRLRRSTAGRLACTRGKAHHDATTLSPLFMVPVGHGPLLLPKYPLPLTGWRQPLSDMGLGGCHTACVQQMLMQKQQMAHAFGQG